METTRKPKAIEETARKPQETVEKQTEEHMETIGNHKVAFSVYN